MNIAAGILINDDGQILLYLRDNKKEIPYPNYWTLLGGHIEDNETPIQALKRELVEEIGHEIKNSLFIGTFYDGVGNKVYVYKCKINKEISEINLTEGQRLGYFKFEESLKLKIPKPLKDFLIENKNKINYGVNQ